MVLRLSDFETEDQPVLRPAQAANHNLLALAKQNNLVVTSCFDPTGKKHNAGSLHYQGSVSDPGAIDVDPHGMTPQRIQQLQAQGYNVRDERSHPVGQDKWTGAHYHISKGSGLQPTSKPGHAATTAQTSTNPNGPIAPFDVSSLQMPVTTDANGNLVINKPSKQRDIGAEIAKATKPVASRKVTDTISLSEFSPDHNDPDEIQAIADRLKPKQQPKAVAPTQPKPHDPNLIEGVVNVGKAGLKYLGDVAHQVGQIPQAMGDEYNQFTTDPNAGVKAAIATGTGFVQGVRDLTQLPLSMPSIAQNAWMGRNVSRPAVELPNVRDIPVVGQSLEQNMQSHPVFSTAGNLVGQSLPVFEGAGQLLRQARPEATTLLKKTAPKELNLPDTPIKTEADLVRRIAEAERRNKPVETVGPGQLNPLKLDNTNPKELTAAFKARGGEIVGAKPKGNLDVQVLGSDGRPLPAAVSDKLPSSYERALQRTREVGPPESAPQIITAKGPAPARRELELGGEPNFINPITGEPYGPTGPSAKESAQVLAGKAEDIHAAEQLHQEALDDVKKQAENVQALANTKDLAEAQQAVGRRINELLTKEQAGTITPEESTSLLQHLEAHQGLLEAQRKYNDAEALLAETKKLSSRAEQQAPEEAVKRPTTREVGQPEKSSLPSAIDLAMRRADAIEQTTRDISNVNAPEPKRIADNPATNLRAAAPRENGPTLLDASGRPMQRELSAPVIERPGAGKPVNPTDLVLPESYKPQPTEVGQVERRAAHETKAGQEAPTEHTQVFTPEGTSPEQASQLKAELQQRILDNGGQLINVAEAKRFQAASGRPGGEHLDTYLDAATRGEDATIKYTPLNKGRKTVETRTISPFGIEKRAIEPATELANLRKQFGSDEAVRSHLIEAARSKGKNVGAGEIEPKAASLKAAIERLGLNEHIYLHSHNFGETSVKGGGTERGYRLDTITESSLTGKKSQIPTSAKYQNEIAAGFNALHEMASHPDATPAFKRAIRQIQKGKISRQSVVELKQALSKKTEAAAKFCQAVGAPQ